MLTATQLNSIAALSTEAYEMLVGYLTSGEASFAKGIPATQENRDLINKIAKVVPLRRRFRGPRAHRVHSGEHTWFSGRSFCRSVDATSIALYCKQY